MEKIAIICFGGNPLPLARRIRQNNVYCDVLSADITAERLSDAGYRGIIMMGDNSLTPSMCDDICDPALFELGIPVLAIGYGARVMIKILGGQIDEDIGTNQPCDTFFDTSSKLFEGLPQKSSCLISYPESIGQIPIGFKITAKTPDCPIAAVECPAKQLFGLQFKPDSHLTAHGESIIKNFLFSVCSLIGEWTPSFLTKSTIRSLKEILKDKRVVCHLSGDIRDTVSALILGRAISDRLTCVYINTGLSRKTDAERLTALMKEHNIRLKTVDASEQIMGQLRGISDNLTKLKTVNRSIARVITEQAASLEGSELIADNLLYTEFINGDTKMSFSALTEGFETVKPLRFFFDGDVIRAAIQLGIPKELIFSPHIPREGITARISGFVTGEKVSVLTSADAILSEEIINSGIAPKLSRYYTLLADTIGYDTTISATCRYTVCIRAAVTDDYTTTDWVKLPYELLDRVSKRIKNEIGEVCRVVFDITDSLPTSAQ